MLFALAAAVDATQPARSDEQRIVQNTSICALKNATPSERKVLPRFVSITAVPYYNFEHGWYLTDRSCKDKEDGTGYLAIDSGGGNKVSGFEQLNETATKQYLKTHAGKVTYCTCEGMVSYGEGFTRFILTRVVKIWTAD
ncbi:MAG: hypothetical protein U1E68_05725 [Sphingomonadaceae bacterium]